MNGFAADAGVRAPYGRTMTDVDWFGWHDAYADPASWLPRRLARVQRAVRDALDAAPDGDVRVLSMCAGQGRDLLEPLAAHPRRSDVRAVLVEQDPRNVAAARAAAAAAGLAGVVVRHGDASLASAYADVAPAHLALVCGVLGNMSDEDVRRTVGALPMLVAQGGRVVWTRHRRDPDLTPAVREWFAAAGFEELAFETEPGYPYAVGAHALTGPSRSLDPALRMFRFVASFTACAPER